MQERLKTNQANFIVDEETASANSAQVAVPVPEKNGPAKSESIFARRVFAWLLDTFFVSGIVAVFVVIFSIGSALSMRSGLDSFIELFQYSILPNFGLLFAFIICWCLSFLNSMAPLATFFVLKLWWPLVPTDYEATIFLTQRVLFFCACLIQCAYSGCFLSRPYAATPGKLLMGLKVLDELGNPLTFFTATKREFLRVFYFFYVVDWLVHPRLKSPQICNSDVVSSLQDKGNKKTFYHPYMAAISVITIIFAVIFRILH